MSDDAERFALPAAARVWRGTAAGLGCAAAGCRVRDFRAQALADRLAVCSTVGEGAGEAESSVSCCAASQSRASRSCKSSCMHPLASALSEVSSILLVEWLVLRFERMEDPE